MPFRVDTFKESPHLARYLQIQLAKFEKYLYPNRGVTNLPTLYVEPVKPRNGDLVYADGTEWNPGSGEGFYGYESGAWVKL